MSPRAVVFAYGDVGDRCLRAVVSAGWQVPLVVTHRADPNERQWFADVATTAKELGIPVLQPDSTEGAGIERTLSQLRPDFLFSFYFRWMLSDVLLASAKRGALNMHGSLLPRYRGRAPVNWAILKGETQTGATLHYMTARADAGDIVDQQAVPILADDIALDVMRKVTVAAEIVLVRSLPLLQAGKADRFPQHIVPGAYHGRRAPEDGRIDWAWPAARIHNLVRAVAPPYPGAYGVIEGTRCEIHRTQLVRGRSEAERRPRLFQEEGRCYIGCGDGEVLRLLSAAVGTEPLDLQLLAKELEEAPRFL